MLGSFIRTFEHRKSGTTRSKFVFGLATGFYPRSLPQNLKLLGTRNGRMRPPRSMNNNV